MKVQRIRSLDFLRFVAAVLILCHHWQQVMGIQFSSGINFYGSIFPFGSMVDLFFLLSGFLTELYWRDDKSFSDFFTKKLAKLLPMLAVSVLLYEMFIYIYAYVGGTDWVFPLEIDVWGIIITCLGMAAGWSFVNPQINNPGWFVSVLLLCYILFYFFQYMIKKKSWNKLYIYVAAVLLSISIGTYGIYLPFVNAYTDTGYYCFFFGAILALYYKKKGPWKGKQVFAGLFVLAIWGILFVDKNEWIKNGMLLQFVLYPIVIMVFMNDKIRKVFNWTFFSVLGEAAYEVYLLQLPLLLFVKILACKGFSIVCNTRLSMAIFCFAVYAVGIIANRFAEKPMFKYFYSKIKDIFLD